MAICISLEGGLVRLTEGQPAGTRGVPADIAHANPSTLGVPHMAVAAATVSQLGQGCDDRQELPLHASATPVNQILSVTQQSASAVFCGQLCLCSCNHRGSRAAAQHGAGLLPSPACLFWLPLQPASSPLSCPESSRHC